MVLLVHRHCDSRRAPPCQHLSSNGNGRGQDAASHPYRSASLLLRERVGDTPTPPTPFGGAQDMLRQGQDDAGRCAPWPPLPQGEGEETRNGWGNTLRRAQGRLPHTPRQVAAPPES